MMSIFSPASSLITPRTRAPIGPMHAPLGLTPDTVDRTAILERCPASRATATISTDPSTSSGTSRANSLRTRLGWVRRQRDLGAAHPARHAHDVAAQPLAVDVALPRHLLGLRQHALGARRRARRARRRGRWPGRRAARRPRRSRPPWRRTRRRCARARRRAAAGRSPGARWWPRSGRSPRGCRPTPGPAAPSSPSSCASTRTDAGLAVDVDAGVRLVALGVLVGGEQRGLDGLDAPSRRGCPCRARWRAARRCRRSFRVLRCLVVPSRVERARSSVSRAAGRTRPAPRRGRRRRSAPRAAHRRPAG